MNDPYAWAGYFLVGAAIVLLLCAVFVAIVVAQSIGASITSLTAVLG